MDIYAKYNGAGWLPEIPARDLTRAEWDALTDERKDAVLACGSYEVIQTKVKNAPTDGPKES